MLFNLAKAILTFFIKKSNFLPQILQLGCQKYHLVFLQLSCCLTFGGQKCQISLILFSLHKIHRLGFNLNQLKYMDNQKTFTTSYLKQKLLPWAFIASSITLSNPLDFVRLRLQVMPELLEQGFVKKAYRSNWECIKDIRRLEGVRAFWKGNLSNMLRILPSEAFIFSIKEFFQKKFHYHQKYSQQKHFYVNSFIGIASAMIVAFTLYPLEYVRQMLSNRVDNSGVGIWHQFKKTIRKSGIRGVYKGVHIFLSSLVLFRGTYFGLYDSLKIKTQDRQMRWLISYFSMLCSVLAVYPGDTVRRRILSSKEKYSGFKHCFLSIWKKQGLKGFFLGWSLNWFQCLLGSTTYYFYDKLFTDYSQATDL